MAMVLLSILVFPSDHDLAWEIDGHDWNHSLKYDVGLCGTSTRVRQGFPLAIGEASHGWILLPQLFES